MEFQRSNCDSGQKRCLNSILINWAGSTLIPPIPIESSNPNGADRGIES